MIIVTGGAGFIGSVLLWKLNQLGMDRIIVVDRLGETTKWNNLVKRSFTEYLEKGRFLNHLDAGLFNEAKAVFHMGASSSTTEMNVDYLAENNIQYSARLFSFCADRGIPFIYASSASTYGDGQDGFSDEEPLRFFRPVHPYGFSKEIFDRWALRQSRRPPSWQGLKFFNVYGPNEYHKGEQASLVFKAFNQIRSEGRVRLFKSHHPDYADGMQLRDFVYAKDVADVMTHFLAKGSVRPSGIYNIGTGQAQSFLDLVNAAFAAMDLAPAIEFIDMPLHLRNQYQYFTEAKMDKLRVAGQYSKPFADVAAGVRDYVQGHLMQSDPYL